MKRLLIILTLLIFYFSGWSQNQKWNVQVRSVYNEDGLDKEISFPQFLTGDSASLKNQFTTLISDLRSSGYLLANLDSIHIDTEKHNVEAWIYTGTKFQWGNITLKTVADNPYDLSRFGLSRWVGKEVSVVTIETSLKKIIEFYENKGYPFSSVTWDSVRIFENRISASLLFDPGPLIHYDSINIDGDAIVKSEFMSSFLGTPVGRPYSRKSVENIPERLESMEYIKISGSPIVTFQNEEARIGLILEKEKANRFDAVIGFLPNESDDRGLLITGTVDLSLKNLFQSGKQVEFHWDRIQKLTQTLNLSYIHPNLLKSQLGLQGDFYLYKQDTSFLNRRIMMGFDYSTGRYGKAFFQSRWESSRLISTVQFIDTPTLPDIADYNITYFGIGFSDLPVRGLNYYSKKTWGIKSEIAAGNKTIKKNSELDQGLYEGVDLSTIQFAGKIQFAGIYKIHSKPYAIYGKLTGGKIINEQLYLNELFRLGGLNSIRGFNENTFYASDYLVATVELQAYFNKASRIFIFFDQGHMSYKLADSNFSDNPFGTGLGLSVESGKGLFSFVYAFGRSEEQPLSIRYSKIHFGYKAIF